MTFQATCLADSPVAGWSFRETGTSVADESGNGYTGELYGNFTTQVASGTATTGDFAATFNSGFPEGVFQADLPSEIINNSAYDTTVELLVKVPVGAHGGLVRLAHIQPRDSLWYSTSNQGTGVGIQAWEGNYLEAWGIRSTKTQVDSVKIPSSTFEIFDGNWHHIVVVFAKYFVGSSRGRIDVYVDGTQLDSVQFGIGVYSFTGGTTGNPNPSRFYVGGSCRTINNDPQGHADDVSVCEAWLYDTEFNQTQVTTHYNAINDTGPFPGAEDEVTLNAPIELYVTENVSLDAPIELFHKLSAARWARIELFVADAVSLNAPVELNTGHTDLVAPIRLNATADISLNAPVWLEAIDTSGVNRSVGHWETKIVIDGVDQSARLTGTVDIDHEVNVSCLAQFTLIPTNGVVDQAALIGSIVEIYYVDKQPDGTVNWTSLEYRGKISDPVYNPAEGTLDVQCTTDLQGVTDRSSREQIEAQLPDSVWSPVVFDEGAQGYSYFSDRLRTVQQDVWHSPSGIRVIDWAAKATADYEFTDDELFVAGPYVPADRRALLNQVDISFDYRFDRKRQRTVVVDWRTTQTFCEFLINGWTLCQRSQVQSVADNGSWIRQNEVDFEPVPPAGPYRCFPFASGPASNKFIIWGREYLGYTLPDPDWDNLCIGAAWKAARRWAQKCTERYAITVKCPQSQNGNGLVSSKESYSLESEQDLTQWLNDEKFSTANPVANGYSVVGNGQTSGDFILGDVTKDATDDLATGRAAETHARSVMIAAGVADVLNAHRQNRVSCVVPYQPELSLQDTVRINSSYLIAKGRVVRKRNIWDIDTGDAVTELELAIFRHEGTGLAVTDPLVPNSEPAKPSETETVIPTRISAKTYVGGRTTTTPLNGDEQGYFSNYVWDPTADDPFASDPANPATILYPEEFAITFPEISGTALNETKLQDAQDIEVEIPVDELTLIQ